MSSYLRSPILRIEEDVFTHEMHVRSDMIAYFGIPDKLTSSERAGLIRHTDAISFDEDTALFSQRKHHDAKRKAQRERLSELRIVQRSLQGIDQIAHHSIEGGFNEINFTCGVLNCILVGYVFGMYPHNFWLVYLIEGLILLPTRLYVFVNARPFNNAFYFFEFTWIANIISLLSILVFCLNAILGHPLSLEYHKYVGLAAVGIACGPLLAGCLVLPYICLLFHDITTMADLFIHIFPPMVMYTFRWSSVEINEAWPNIFVLDYMQDLHFYPVQLGSIAGDTLLLYVLWYVFYIAWMLVIGMNLPQRDKIGTGPTYDTVFHSLMRAGLCIVIGSSCWGRPRSESIAQMDANHFQVRDFLVYMTGHYMFCITAIFTLGYMCFASQTIHGLLLILVTVVTVHRGARRYTYYATTMYGKLLRKQFADLLGETSQESDESNFWTESEYQ